MRIVSEIYNPTEKYTNAVVREVNWEDVKEAATKAYNSYRDDFLDEIWKSWEFRSKRNQTKMFMNELLEDVDDAIRSIEPNIITDTQYNLQRKIDESNKKE